MHKRAIVADRAFVYNFKGRNVNELGR